MLGSVKYLESFTDRRHLSGCHVCGCKLATTREHVPPRTFLDPPRPDCLPTAHSCRKCNTSTSMDEQYVACVIEAAACKTVDPSGMQRPAIARALSRRPALASRLKSAARERDGTFVIEIETWRLSRVLDKVARGLYFYELGEPPLDMTAQTSWNGPAELTPQQRQLPGMSTPRALEHEVHTLLPLVGSRSLQRLLVVPSPQVADSGWQVVQRRRFRYQVSYGDSVTTVRMVIRGILTAETLFAKSSRSNDV